MKQPINEIKRMQQLAGLITESEYQSLEEKMSYDDFEQMIKPFLDLAKSKGWIWNSSGDSWFDISSPAIALYHSTELPTTADGEYKGQKMLASKDVTIGNQVQTYRGDIEKKQGDVIMQSDYGMDQAYFQSKDKAILDAIKASMANVTDVIQDAKESSSQLTSSKDFEPVKYYSMLLRKKQTQQAESQLNEMESEDMIVDIPRLSQLMSSSMYKSGSTVTVNGIEVVSMGNTGRMTLEDGTKLNSNDFADRVPDIKIDGEPIDIPMMSSTPPAPLNYQSSNVYPAGSYMDEVVNKALREHRRKQK